MCDNWVVSFPCWSIVVCFILPCEVIYCSIPKVASTTWKTILVRSLDGRSADQMAEHAVEDERLLRSVGLRFLSTLSHEEAEKRIETYFKFVVVRHPFDRIVSAYRDKIARFNPYGEKIRDYLANRYAEANGAKGFGDSRQIGAFKHSTRFQKISFGHFVRYALNLNGRCAHLVSSADLPR